MTKWKPVDGNKAVDEEVTGIVAEVVSVTHDKETKNGKGWAIPERHTGLELMFDA